VPGVFAAAAYANLGISGAVVEGLWNDRILGGMGPNTRRAYHAGFTSFVNYSRSMGWEYPYLGGRVEDDSMRIVGWVDHMAVDEGKPVSTVDSYITGAKTELLLDLVLSDALGKRGDARHVWIRNAVASVAKSILSRVAYRSEWILEGRRFWTVPVYVAVVLIYMAALRSGELLANYSGGRGEHLLCWENLEFQVSHGIEVRPLSRGELARVCADTLQITFDSRKWQDSGRVRPIPPITRLFPKPQSGSPAVDLSDCREKVELCAVTLLQSWFLLLRVHGPVNEKQTVMQCGDGKLLGSRVVIESMRTISTGHGADPKDVVIHSLKHGALTALGGAGASAVDIAMAGGHKTIESSVPYLHPELDQGRRNSEILGRKRGLE
jgi:hypothetical protein